MEYYLLFSTRYLTLKSIHYVIYFLLSFCIVFFLWGRGACSPGNFWKWIYAKMQSGLRHNFEKCYSVCIDPVAFGWFFRYSYLFTVMITIFLGGKLGIFLGGGGSFYPTNNLDRTLSMILSKLATTFFTENKGFCNWNLQYNTNEGGRRI